MQDYDVIIIGGGPGGYVAAIRCAQLGLHTACVESWRAPDGTPALGGTCLNVGCIPSKALLDSSHHYEDIRNHAAIHGIKTTAVEIDIATLMTRKAAVVTALTQGIAGLFKKHKVEWIQGRGRLAGPSQVTVLGPDGAESATLRAPHIIIATGSEPIALPQAPVDQHQICDSTGALSFSEVPGRLAVIGAGAIGIELGSVWRRLGSQVVVLEALPEFLPAADPDIAKEARRILTRQGLDIRLGARLTGTAIGAGGVTVNYEQDGTTQTIEVDRLIVAVGRRPHTTGLGAAEAGLKLSERGFIEVDGQCRTNLPGVYAIGDVVGGPMLAHKASEEGVAVAELIAGQTPRIHHELVPWVIYTWPEIAWVGASERALSASGRRFRAGRFPFLANGRARAMHATEGFVKILADAVTDEILGVHIIGAGASELIAEAVLAMAFSASSEDLARTIHAHPTLAEAMHEAALAVDGHPLHI